MSTRAEYAARPGRSSKWIARGKRLAIYIRDGFRCQWCNRDLADAKPWEMGLDHLVTRSNGGTDEPCNLILACSKCNFSRQDRPWRGFAPNAGVITRILRTTRRVLNRPLALSLLRGETTPWEILDV